MIAYFAAAPEGKEVLADYAKLLAWWRVIRKRKSVLGLIPVSWICARVYLDVRPIRRLSGSR